MFEIVKPKVVRIAAFPGLLLLANLACLRASAQDRPPGPVTGVIDAISYERNQYYVSGWACQEGIRGSIEVHLYAGHAAGDNPPGAFVTGGTADLANEPAVGRECHDGNGGKHRFRIAVPNQLLRSFHQKKLYVHGIALADNFENAVIAGSGSFSFPEPKWPPDPPTPNFINGPAIAAFDTQRDACEQIDIPDAAARAFRDYKGTIHLIASHSITRAGLGATLETTKHNCQIVYNSPHDGNIAEFNDYTWLNTFYNVDGKKIVALGHMEFHGWEHGLCKVKTDTNDCWFNVDTFNVSEDGGYHFSRPKPPANYFLSLPYKYEVSQGPEGYSVDSNIIKVGQWYYDSVSGWPWPPNCGAGKGQRPCLVPGGVCPIRTSNILDGSSWRGWDGKDFTVTFADPYRGPVANPAAHVCKPVENIDFSTGFNYYEPSHLFIATIFTPGDTGYGVAGVYFSTSTDFVNWSKPALALTMNQMLRREPLGNWSYQYFSLIDPKSSDSSFMTITETPYLYYVRMDGDHPPYQRVLFRQRINLAWLLQTHHN